MGVVDHDSSPDVTASALLRNGADSELRLLKQERKAERRLAAARHVLSKDEDRLCRFQDRVNRSRHFVATAEDALRECQERRSAGPSALAD